MAALSAQNCPGVCAFRSGLLRAFVALTVAAVLSLAAAMGKWEVVAGIAGGLVSLLVLVRFPRVHWFMFFGIMPWFFRQSDVGVSLFDAAFAVYLATLLGGWWVRAWLGLPA